MSGSIEEGFVRQYQAEVQEAYQRQGSKLRQTVRSKTGIAGGVAVFQKLGRGRADGKVRNGLVPLMSLVHGKVECLLQDYYAGEWIDRLDEIKVNHDERAVVANAGAYALGRKTDELIIGSFDAVPSSRNAVGTAAGTTDADGLTRAKVLLAFEMLGAADVPDDGNRFAVVGWKQWSELLTIQEFATAEYVGADQLPWKGTQAKRWLGALWMPHSGLSTTGAGGSIRQCYFYHKTAVAHAVAAEIATDITWHGDRAAYFVNTMMSQGAVLVDETGIVRMRTKE